MRQAWHVHLVAFVIMFQLSAGDRQPHIQQDALGTSAEQTRRPEGQANPWSFVCYGQSVHLPAKFCHRFCLTTLERCKSSVQIGTLSPDIAGTVITWIYKPDTCTALRQQLS
jgi:hypothetical protein